MQRCTDNEAALIQQFEAKVAIDTALFNLQTEEPELEITYDRNNSDPYYIYLLNKLEEEELLPLLERCGILSKAEVRQRKVALRAKAKQE
jgi:hypothetical protein